MQIRLPLPLPWQVSRQVRGQLEAVPPEVRLAIELQVRLHDMQALATLLRVGDVDGEPLEGQEWSWQRYLQHVQMAMQNLRGRMQGHMQRWATEAEGELRGEETNTESYATGGARTESDAPQALLGEGAAGSGGAGEAWEGVAPPLPADAVPGDKAGEGEDVEEGELMEEGQQQVGVSGVGDDVQVQEGEDDMELDDSGEQQHEGVVMR